MNKAWKDCEREVACALGGTRRVRISYSESCEDVIHPTLAIEVKYGKQVPKSLIVEHPTYRGSNVLIPSKFIHQIVQCVGSGNFRREEKWGGDAFINAGLVQAASYNSDKTPVLCVKRPRTRGFVLIFRQADYEAYLRRLRAHPQWTRLVQGLAPGGAIFRETNQ